MQDTLKIPLKDLHLCMILPTYQSIKRSAQKFIEEEALTVWSLLNPLKILRIFLKYRVIHFLITGGIGVLLNLVLTWALTEFYFGREHYFNAYIIGLVVNTLYNFTFYTLFIFRTEKQHFSRFAVFVVYGLSVASLQAFLTKKIVDFVGHEWYLIVIPLIILFFSFFSFLFYKLSIFKEKKSSMVP